ncbi:MAG TPA: hypothetical protein VI916_02525 [Acidimicrobiia bacterium]|nr:hypothetical protein [Acidimicrobiia bacterium]
MSFLYDPPALAATGYVIGRVAPSRRWERLARGATLVTFIGTSVALYRNDPWTKPLVDLFGARSGRDWMLNSGITNFDENHADDRVHRAAAVVFALYPVFLAWGARRGHRARA